jgi:hypothetical protein
MTVSPPGELDQVNERNALVTEFLSNVSRDLERLRSSSHDPDALDSAWWRRLQSTAHNIGARSEALKLGVMRRCALELEQFSAEVLTPTDSGASDSIQGAMIALEIVELELRALQSDAQARDTDSPSS